MRELFHLHGLFFFSTTNNTLCATTLLDDLQQVTGSLSLSNISALPQIVMGSSFGLPTYITCSDCVKQAYNILKQEVPEVATSTDVTNAFQSQCGSSFLDGTSPSQIAEGTGNRGTIVWFRRERCFLVVLSTCAGWERSNVNFRRCWRSCSTCMICLGHLVLYLFSLWTIRTFLDLPLHTACVLLL